MAGKVDINDIVLALRRGDMTEGAAVAFMEQRIQAAKLAEQMEPRQVRAHWDPATRSQVIDALDSALGGDEFAGLFPPSSPLGGEHEEEPTAPTIYPGEDQSRRDRRPVTSWDGYVSAGRDDYPSPRPWSAMSPVTNMPDEEAALLWPPESEEEADRRASEAARVRAARVEDLADEQLHEILFGSTTGLEAGG